MVVTRDASGAVWETKTKTSSKVQVEIRHCCCCSLKVAAILTAIYTIVMYVVFLALAAVSLRRILSGEPDPKPDFTPVATLRPDQNTIIVIDPYFDTLGLYTEELKYGVGIRFPVLIINIVIFCLLIVAAILVIVAVLIELPWLLLPWIGLMCAEILRGTISVILIFVFSGGDIRRIAVGIFFLGLQLFHMSLVLIMIACFQYLMAKKRGQEFPVEQADRKSVAYQSGYYPNMPTSFDYGDVLHTMPPYASRPAEPPASSGWAPRPRSRPESPNRFRDDYGNRSYYTARSGYSRP